MTQYHCTRCKEAIEGDPAIALPGLYLCAPCASHCEARAKRMWNHMRATSKEAMMSTSEFDNVQHCTGCGWLLSKNAFAPGSNQCNTCCKKAAMEYEPPSGAAPSFGGVCDVCLCVYDRRGIRTRPLTEAQYSVLQSVRGESKRRGMCKVCFTVEGTVAAMRKLRGDNRIAGCHSKDNDYTEPGVEGGIQ